MRVHAHDWRFGPLWVPKMSTREAVLEELELTLKRDGLEDPIRQVVMRHQPYCHNPGEPEVVD